MTVLVFNLYIFDDGKDKETEAFHNKLYTYWTMSTQSCLDERKSAIKFLMRGLAYKNYRLFFGGQIELHELREGFRYVFGFAPIKYIIGLVGMMSLLSMPYIVLMPVFARDILHGGSHTLGFLMGATGIGAPLTLAGCGVLSIVCAVLFYNRLPQIRKSARPIYLRMGIIQKMPTELQ